MFVFSGLFSFYLHCSFPTVLCKMQGTRQPGCGFFEWFYEDVQDDKGHVIMARLEKLSKKLDDATMEIEKVKLTNEELRKEINKIMKLKKIWMLFVILGAAVVIMIMMK